MPRITRNLPTAGSPRVAEERNLLLEIKVSNKNTCINTKQMSKQIVIYT